MSYQLSEMARKLSNLARVGTVEHVDYAKAVAKVRFGAIVTHWLHWLADRAGNDRSWWAPEVGEQVLVIAPDGNLTQGIILLSLYQQASPQPAASPDVRRITFKDGAVLEYDRASHKLKATVPGDVEINATGTIQATAGAKITLSAPLVELDAQQIRLIGPVESGGRDGAAFPLKLNGPIEHVGGNYVNEENDVLVQGISSAHHTHECPHGGQTGEPR